MTKHPSVPTVFDLCTPRADILQGRVTEAEFAADLARVLATEAGAGYADYADPARFFANTYPTRGLKDLLANVCRSPTYAADSRVPAASWPPSSGSTRRTAAGRRTA